MTSLIEDYVNRVDFDSYEDFHKNLSKKLIFLKFRKVR